MGTENEMETYSPSMVTGNECVYSPVVAYATSSVEGFRLAGMPPRVQTVVEGPEGYCLVGPWEREKVEG